MELVIEINTNSKTILREIQDLTTIHLLILLIIYFQIEEQILTMETNRDMVVRLASHHQPWDNTIRITQTFPWHLRTLKV